MIKFKYRTAANGTGNMIINTSMFFPTTKKNIQVLLDVIRDAYVIDDKTPAAGVNVAAALIEEIKTEMNENRKRAEEMYDKKEIAAYKKKNLDLAKNVNQIAAAFELQGIQEEEDQEHATMKKAIIYTWLTKEARAKVEPQEETEILHPKFNELVLCKVTGKVFEKYGVSFEVFKLDKGYYRIQVAKTGLNLTSVGFSTAQKAADYVTEKIAGTIKEDKTNTVKEAKKVLTIAAGESNAEESKEAEEMEMAKNIIEEAKRQAAEIIAKAKAAATAKAARITETATEEAAKIIKAARDTATQEYSEARFEASHIIEEAERKAAEITATTKPVTIVAAAVPVAEIHTEAAPAALVIDAETIGDYIPTNDSQEPETVTECGVCACTATAAAAEIHAAPEPAAFTVRASSRRRGVVRRW